MGNETLLLYATRHMQEATSQSYVIDKTFATAHFERAVGVNAQFLPRDWFHKARDTAVGGADAFYPNWCSVLIRTYG
jgi:hypothetical protein